VDLLRKLVATAQVFIENYRPGTLEEMGIGPEALRAINRKLIIVRVSGWGQDGPYRDKPGFGSLVEGMSTFAAKNGFADRPPVLPPLALADMIAGLYGANAVLIALREVERGGAGQVIDLPLLDPIFSILGPEAALYKLTGKIEPRVGSRSNNTAPRNVYETKDGRFISISASIQSMAERLYRAIGRADMIEDPRFRTNTDRVKNIDEAERPVAEFIKARSLGEALAVFEAAEVTAAPVYSIDQFIADPHVQARAIVTELPDDEMGAVPMHAVVPRLLETPGEIRRPAPGLGEHNESILGALGFGAEQIAVLRERKVI
jgi:crotonobetainyl-CoA:carnitine CoA-transferase CaiB-like acyl-CoA transferase